MSLIVDVIHRWHPEWEPPYDTGREWISCRCPFHGDESPSAAVSLTRNAFKCFACPVKGDAISLLEEREGVSFAEAIRIAKEVSPSSNGEIPGSVAGFAGRKVFGEPRAWVPERKARGRSVHVGIRRRSSPWA